MSKLVKIHLPKYTLVVTHDEWMRYIDPHIPYPIRLAGTKRGKGEHRFQQSMNRKGNGRHGTHS